MPAPYRSDDLTPNRQGRSPDDPKGPVLQSMPNQQSSRQQGQPAPQQQEAQMQEMQRKKGGWQQFFGYLRENPEAIAFLANVSQSALDPRAQGDPGAMMRAGFQGMANYRTILNELQQQEEEGQRAERQLELESQRVGQGERRLDLGEDRLEQDQEQFEAELALRERELAMQAEKYNLKLEKLKEPRLSPKDAENIYTSIYDRQLEMLKSGPFGELPEDAEGLARRRANAELLQFRPDLVRFSPNWTEEGLANAAAIALEEQNVPTMARDVYLEFGPEARNTFLKNVRKRAAQAQGSLQQQPGQNLGPQSSAQDGGALSDFAKGVFEQNAGGPMSASGGFSGVTPAR